MSDRVDPHYEEIVADTEQLRNQEQIVNVEEESLQLVLFKLLEQRFAIPGQHVRELMAAGEIVYVPGTTELFLGVVPVRGEIASVLDLARLLGLTTTSSSKVHSSRILMVVQGEMSTGVLVDRVEDIINIPESAIQPHLSSLDPQLVQLTDGQFLFDAHPTPVLNVAAIFQHLQELCG
ncbi:MAG: chemotaxis protein CheW [Magnetococcus sp. MYC-9]